MIRYFFFFFFIVSFTDALDKAKRGLYTSDLDDFEAQTTSITSKILLNNNMIISHVVLFILASITELQRKSTFVKTPRNSLKRLNTALLDSSQTSDLKTFKKKKIINEKKMYMKDKSSNSTQPLINCNNDDDDDDDVNHDQCNSSEICKSMLFSY